jgi:hypothetical protein
VHEFRKSIIKEELLGEILSDGLNVDEACEETDPTEAQYIFTHACTNEASIIYFLFHFHNHIGSSSTNCPHPSA